MRIKLLVLVLGLSPLFAFGQKCNCGSEFSFLASYIERNYPGFKDKIPTYGKFDYKKFTGEYQTKAAREKNSTYCMILLNEWLRYFQDNHLHIEPAQVKGSDSMLIGERIKNTERISVTPAMINKIKKSNGIEGVYYKCDSIYKVAVIKRPNSWRTYAAVVLESKNRYWTPGMVKYEMKEKNDSEKYEGKWYTIYPCLFYNDQHEPSTNTSMSFSGYGMDGGVWKKEGLKESADEQAERNKWMLERKNNPQKKQAPSFIEINKPGNDCALLRIKTFKGELAQQIDSFLIANDSLISHTPNLIIDLRNNGGGADRSYKLLLPYLYTRPIVTTGVGFFSTTDNIEAVRRAGANTESERVKHVMEDEAREMEQYTGHYTPVGNDTLVMDSVKKHPEKIVILINGNCASTTEQFLLAAQQSGKVVLMGRATSGTLDYSNDRPKPFPCIPYTLEYPISRSGRLPQHPIDNIGIKPDVELSDTTDWIKEAIDYLKHSRK